MTVAADGGREWTTASIRRTMLTIIVIAAAYGAISRAVGLASYDIESEYLPPEIATRGIYVFAVTAFIALAHDSPGPRGATMSPASWSGDRMPPIVPGGVALGSALMVLFENNWDLDQRETITGTVLFAMAFVACLFPYFVRTLRRQLSAALLLLLGALMLFLGEVIDHADILPESISEEGFELFGAIAVLWSFLLFAQREMGAATHRLLLSDAIWPLLLGTSLFTVGNTLLMFNHGEWPPPWQMVEGAVLSIAGAVVLWRTTAEAVRMGRPIAGSSIHSAP